MKDEALYRRIIPSAVNPNGEVNLTGLKRDLVFFRELGLIESKEVERRWRGGCFVRESGGREARPVSAGSQVGWR